jgi:hypothetical protein
MCIFRCQTKWHWIFMMKTVPQQIQTVESVVTDKYRCTIPLSEWSNRLDLIIDFYNIFRIADLQNTPKRTDLHVHWGYTSWGHVVVEGAITKLQRSFNNNDDKFGKENIKTTNRAQQIYIIYPSWWHRMRITLHFWRNTPTENVKEWMKNANQDLILY